ncbi:small integral membrane protein 19 isoform X2 [Mixophyes fleayi]|uniref:small integral membrane protein 19 isoform X2 n=1 Tax=Mixophyes fleayi TaxID=3061075 RepID=UPI003F4DD0EE
MGELSAVTNRRAALICRQEALLRSRDHTLRPGLYRIRQVCRNKRKIMRIFTVPPTVETASPPNFYDDMKKIRLRQQLEMYYIARKHDQHSESDSVQLTVE